MLRLQLKLITELLQEEAYKEVDGVDALSKTASNGQLFSLVIGLAICAILALPLPAYITRPLNNMLAKLHDINHGNGNLTSRIGLTQTDEIGQLSQAFDAFLSKLHGIGSNITETSAEQSQVTDRIGHHLNEISDASHHTADSAKLTNESTRLMIDLAEALADEMRKFKI